MNLQRLIIYILAVTGYGICQSKKSSDGELSEEAAQLYNERWTMEMTELTHGLKIKNNKGELEQLELDDETLRVEAMTSLRTNVRFYAYTKWNPTDPEELSTDLIQLSQQLRLSYFDAGKETIFVTHGWGSNGNSTICTSIRDAYLENYNVNVIVVDWSDVRVKNYEYAARQSIFIGDCITKFINALSEQAHLYLEDVTLIGYSMGAHIMGMTSYQTGSQINTIFGLDPSLLLFTDAGVGYGLTKNDAKYVQIIHTNAGHLGISEAVGHADLYVNGGEYQNGCNNQDNCSHSRAYEYFAESISLPNRFSALKFDTYANLRTSLLSSNSTNELKINVTLGGHPADKSLSGIYNVEYVQAHR